MPIASDSRRAIADRYDRVRLPEEQALAFMAGGAGIPSHGGGTLHVRRYRIERWYELLWYRVRGDSRRWRTFPPGLALARLARSPWGFCTLCSHLLGRTVTKATLAKLAAEIEIDILKRNIGAQDHYAAAYENINVVTFRRDGSVLVEPVFYSPTVKRQSERNLMLFYTALKCDASEILRVQREETPRKFDVLRQMRDLVPRLKELDINPNPA